MSGRGARGLGVLLTLALTGMGLVFIATVVDMARRIDNPMPALGAIVCGVVLASLFFGPVGKAIGKMLEGESRPDDDTVMRLEDVEARLAELSLEQQRVAELEDRLDFAERLLATHDAAALRRPQEDQ